MGDHRVQARFATLTSSRSSTSRPAAWNVATMGMRPLDTPAPGVLQLTTNLTKNVAWVVENDHPTADAQNPYMNAPAASEHIDVLSNVLQVRF